MSTMGSEQGKTENKPIRHDIRRIGSDLEDKLFDEAREKLRQLE